MELARSKYAGFNDSHLTEKLVQVEKIAVSRETVRRLLRGAKPRSPQYRKVSSPAPSLWASHLKEGRGPALTLIGYQDPALFNCAQPRKSQLAGLKNISKRLERPSVLLQLGLRVTF